ncbi:MAG: MEKHLA domain-containing protein [Alphaproteobacteria bacterium]|nr:MEKHLA domain-containing protein [Alphaproteobacteria bacterium]
MRAISPEGQPETVAYSVLLAQSFTRWLRRPLLPAAADAAPEVLARLIYDAPFALVSHGTQQDPVFRYANRRAQALFGYDWDIFVTLPSRLSAEPAAQEERRALLDTALRAGYAEHYRGIRIAKDGRRFEIRDAVLWNVTDAHGAMAGQAARFDQWNFL